MAAPAAVRAATAEDLGRLTEIAQAAKAHWGYPDWLLALWRADLTFNAELLARAWVRVAEDGAGIVAVVALAGQPPRLELEHLWVDPPAMGRGIGRQLFRAAATEAHARQASELEIVSDPNAASFYEHLGARRVGQRPSLPKGRFLPVLHLELAGINR